MARYTLAVDRRFKRDNDQQTADFIGCVAFGRSAEFAEKYFRKGIKIAILEGSKLEVTPIRTGRKYTQQMLLWRNRNLQRARLQVTARPEVSMLQKGRCQARRQGMGL